MKYFEKSTGAFLGGLMVNFTALVVSTPTVGDGTVVGEVLGRVYDFGGGRGDFLLSILG